MFNTPIVFLIFNRPEYTEQAFTAIRKAQPTTLLVVADGPRNADEALLCEKTRSIVEQIDWECDVHRNYADTNMGCRDRVSSGLDWAFSLVESAIILEDDCLPDPSFFSFCEKMLRHYWDDERVMMVSGTNYTDDSLAIDQSYTFSQYYAIWGWATWRRAWKKFDVNMKLWPEFKAQGQIDGLRPYAHVALLYTSGWDQRETLDSWAYPWAFACMFNHGLSVVPRVNLVSNIGLYGKHHHGANGTLNMQTYSMDTENIVHPEMVFPDIRYDGSLRGNPLVFAPIAAPPPPPPPLYFRVLRKLWRLTGGRFFASPLAARRSPSA